MSHKSWPDIALFYVNRSFYTDPEHADWSLGKVTYRAKVKLHGKCAGVQRLADGTLEAQSREVVLTPQEDMDGFAKWALAQAWEGLPVGTVLFGEWCGPKVQKGTAINKIPERIFAVFGARQVTDGQHDPPVAEPAELEKLAAGVRGAYVLPWHGEPIEFDWQGDEESLSKIVNLINASVEAVETCDPWAKDIFGVEGTGEGLVYTPVACEKELKYAPMFKAKGEKYRVIKSHKAVRLAPEVVQNIDLLVKMILPDPRLEQGITATGKAEIMNIGEFIKWVIGDVRKEAKIELAANGITFEQASKALMVRARNWYIAEIRK